jgi:hypothetical protein
MIGIEEGDNFEELQEFEFMGGGDAYPEDVPPKVKEAFDKWCERLCLKGGLRQVTVRVVSLWSCFLVVDEGEALHTSIGD